MSVISEIFFPLILRAQKGVLTCFLLLEKTKDSQMYRANGGDRRRKAQKAASETEQRGLRGWRNPIPVCDSHPTSS